MDVVWEVWPQTKGSDGGVVRSCRFCQGVDNE